VVEDETMPNVLDESDGVFLVLVNDHGRHSLWPDKLELPVGWKAAFGPNDRQQWVNFADKNWDDIRPK
jgi:MbtH protein